MTFSDALEKMKAGMKMTRRKWPFDDIVYVEYTAATLQPYLVVQAPEHEAIPYTATDVDIFSDDWEVVQ